LLTKFGMMLSTALLSMCSPQIDAAKPIEGRCVQYEPLLELVQPETGWNIVRMSKIMFRESRCTPNIRSTTSDTGLLQINDVNHTYLGDQWGTHVSWGLLTNPTLNVLAAAQLFDYWHNATGNGYQPWKLTDRTNP